VSHKTLVVENQPNQCPTLQHCILVEACTNFRVMEQWYLNLELHNSNLVC